VHGRIEQRSIHVLPAEALSVECRDVWKSIRQIAKAERIRHIKKKVSGRRKLKPLGLSRAFRHNRHRQRFCLDTTASIGALKIIYTGIRMQRLVKIAAQTARTTHPGTFFRSIIPCYAYSKNPV
jgi:hypothetical protein